MEKEFCTYNQAVALKELGFNEPCLRMSEHRKICEEQAKPGGCQLHNLHCGYPDCTKDKSIVPVPLPLKQQVFRFFREKYGLIGWVDGKRVYRWCIESPIPTDGQLNLSPFRTYEEAENDCIDKLIEIAKRQSK